MTTEKLEKMLAETQKRLDACTVYERKYEVITDQYGIFAMFIPSFWRARKRWHDSVRNLGNLSEIAD